MQNVDVLLEHYRNKMGISKEAEDAEIAQLRSASAVAQLQHENDQLKKRLESTEQALLFMMDMNL